MDFNELLVTHTKWKVRLRNYINGHPGQEEQLDPDLVSREDLCDLGKWINEEGRQFAGNAHYEQLKTDHAYFHKCAAEVVNKVKAGDVDGASRMLGPGGEFSDVSSAVVSAMNQLQRHALATQAR